MFRIHNKGELISPNVDSGIVKTIREARRKRHQFHGHPENNATVQVLLLKCNISWVETCPNARILYTE